MGLKEQVSLVKIAACAMAGTAGELRNDALCAIADALTENKEKIFEANHEDMIKAKEDGVPTPILNRLKFNEDKLKDVISGIRDLVSMEDPLSKTLLKRELDENLLLIKETCPIGVIGVIFEARPDALVQISALCIKSGNCVILKGGSEAARSNKVLFDIIYDTAVRIGLPQNCMMQLEARSQINELLTCQGDVDLLIPRGSNAFVRYIMENTNIPVMGHSDGICHIYVDKEADMDKAVRIILDAKTQYVSACNAVETLLVHKDVLDKFMPVLSEALKEKQVELRGSSKIREVVSCKEAVPEDDDTEYLDYILSAREVQNVDEAIEHINKHGSRHTECIITENDDTALYFMKMVDAAGVYQNCSTRFADGYRYGFGAEVGISTSKLHARGPVGLEGLLSYKYKLFGKGQTVGDYASGKNSFHFKDII